MLRGAAMRASGLLVGGGGGTVLADSYSYTREEDRPPLRVLVTGFNDWKDLKGNLMRCRDNPTCRLLVGDPCEAPPAEKRGPLIAKLEGMKYRMDHALFTFETLPVVWGGANKVDYKKYDVIVSLGLGDSKQPYVLQLERGATNLREGRDANGAHPPSKKIDAGAGATLHRERTSDNVTKLVERDRRYGKFEVHTAEARESNKFICNETHYAALVATQGAQLAAQPSTAAAYDGALPKRALRGAYFVHCPGVEDDNHDDLANGVAQLIAEILDIERT
ncbi:hypothetical protein M885DRAFT_510694 [Pelagophyceae sp. CCMP2097]|nr:hypothetical protein M885DRAFT_510694 [Pelagophyceae sp. CCMP2097]|mmetsp:Transcript_18730/g.64395  ORF Transcript_18730/g.64395 Transcript_18730/m.64395 type:complete len:277 (-) Transcript_18730:184-1014(-)